MYVCITYIVLFLLFFAPITHLSLKFQLGASVDELHEKRKQQGWIKPWGRRSMSLYFADTKQNENENSEETGSEGKAHKNETNEWAMDIDMKACDNEGEN